MPNEQVQRAFAALGSRVRLRILDALAIRPMSLPELSRELELNRTTLRYHLAVLQEQGWIRETSPAKTQGSGRPAARYCASPHAWVGFPERHFELLGEIALRALLESTGPDQTTAALRAKGTALGRDLLDGAAARAALKQWSPDAFEQLVLHGLFRDFGVVGEVVARTPDDLTYRVYTCPFLELAEKMPGLVCDAVDAGFHEGIDQSMGDVATAKMACMGHGDPFCEYRLSWSRKPMQTTLQPADDGDKGHRDE
ncbi:MAG TPA: helix-turn-helix domain-containing protein [Thermoplasmata archaeon]|nr:helix-turn-helix domain-containing protein [Thermoplasmata archaeon]